jgi:GTPase SAR1 family protein
MMVGLPGAGKSFWVEQHCAINTDKKYVVLSTNKMINQMKVNIRQ